MRVGGTEAAVWAAALGDGEWEVFECDMRKISGPSKPI
jgi:hypothetical protein